MSDHDWQGTGVIIATAPSFAERACARCGCVAWGNSTSGEFVPVECHGNHEAFRAWYRETMTAHNRRAAQQRPADLEDGS